jgi:5-methylcytosine-specific restriction endonuclease McrA
MFYQIRLSDEENLDDFESDDWAEKLGFRLVDDLRDRADEEAERDGGYVKDWEYRSYELRSSKDFICENCGADLSKHQYLLHVHHRDQDKGNNQESNLLVVCVLCHAGFHPHMLAEIRPENEALILSMRRV